MLLVDILNFLSRSIAVAGVFVVVWGVLLAILEFLYLEYKSIFIGHTICVSREKLRHHLGSYLLLGLEILIAADVIMTVVNPTLNEILMLGAIVVIRTVLNFFLNRELDQNHKCK